MLTITYLPRMLLLYKPPCELTSAVAVRLSQSSTKILDFSAPQKISRRRLRDSAGWMIKWSKGQHHPWPLLKTTWQRTIDHRSLINSSLTLLGLSSTVRMDSFHQLNSRTRPDSIEETPVQFWTKPFTSFQEMLFKKAGRNKTMQYVKLSFDEGITTRECTVSKIECGLRKQFKLHCFSYWSVYFSSATVQTNKHRPLLCSPVLGGEPRPPRDAKQNFTWAGKFFLVPCSRFKICLMRKIHRRKLHKIWKKLQVRFQKNTPSQVWPNLIDICFSSSFRHPEKIRYPKGITQKPRHDRISWESTIVVLPQKWMVIRDGLQTPTSVPKQNHDFEFRVLSYILLAFDHSW